VNTGTRSALNKAAGDVENAALWLPGEGDDESLTPGEARQIRSLTARLNDAAIQMRNLADRAEARERKARR
jgi:hypothetical protein